MAAPSHVLPFLSPAGGCAASSARAHSGYRAGLLRCSAAAGQAGFFTRLGRLIKEKAKSDVEKLFSGFSKTRENLSVVDELLTYWNLADTDRVLDDLEEVLLPTTASVLPLTLSAACPICSVLMMLLADAHPVTQALLVSDFGPKISFRIVDTLREEIRDGKLKSGAEIKAALKRCILELLTSKGGNSELNLGFRKPAVIMIVGVNGGGKTTSLGKLAYRFKNEGVKVLMAAGDTFRAAARDQLEVWAERTGSEIVIDNDKKAQPPAVLSQAVKRGKREGFDVVLCDTSGSMVVTTDFDYHLFIGIYLLLAEINDIGAPFAGLHTNYGLMEELVSCKKVLAKALPGAPNEILLVLDGTTGLNMLQQAREFNDVVGVTGFILTKLDGTARGGCVVSVVDELGIPVKFIGVGEGMEDLQPFDAEAFVEAIFP
ncbi:Cell division protein FtsY, chloroplastic [Zea mays]|uniref:Cell division protein FtsY, chloroplastic n=2 Tax=Zea mays TaxID=4577 RepID=A0A8J8XQD9_MAIZE|nr:Cell division protein FtsY homolog chloroplastic [Zea mays]PWZ32906.1 Cell division protein FtsY, chloroplastic [Zea mays]